MRRPERTPPDSLQDLGDFVFLFGLIPCCFWLGGWGVLLALFLGWIVNIIGAPPMSSQPHPQPSFEDTLLVIKQKLDFIEAHTRALACNPAATSHINHILHTVHEIKAIIHPPKAN